MKKDIHHNLILLHTISYQTKIHKNKTFEIDKHSYFCEVKFAKKRKVENHIGTVHVIAICNGLEMAMGFMAEASIPKNLRWIPKGMEVNYTAKAGTDIRCVAEIPGNQWTTGDLFVPVQAFDTEGNVVVDGTIKLWVTEKQAK